MSPSSRKPSTDQVSVTPLQNGGPFPSALPLLPFLVLRPRGQRPGPSPPGHQPRPTCSLICHMVRFWSSPEQATRMYLSQLPAPAGPASTQNFSLPSSSETCPEAEKQTVSGVLLVGNRLFGRTAAAGLASGHRRGPGPPSRPPGTSGSPAEGEGAPLLSPSGPLAQNGHQRWS